MNYETILFEEKDHIGLLTLNRPKTINALNRTMIEAWCNFIGTSYAS